ncbi:hypothetical protein BKI52_07785 [marine bacterium AO1-C]|nr:hypothetical protein BKI52_07785 [marine bacterium AO1-C]
MKIKLHANDFQDALLERQYPMNYVVDGGIVEQEFSADIFGIRGSYREILMKNIRIGYGNMAMVPTMELSFETDFETVEMYFLLKGDSSMVNTETHQTLEISPNQHNIFYTDHFRGKASHRGTKGLLFFEVNLIPDFFSQYLPDSSPEFYDFLKKMSLKENTHLNKDNYSITPQMHFVIREILQCKRQGIFKKMFLEAKVLELLMLQLEQVSSENNQQLSISAGDKEKMYAVRDFIIQNLENHTTLAHLARQVGTNEFSLKRDFKALFGTTVFGYWNELKMEKAKHLLLHEDIPINVISEKIGYKNPQHFTTAFKKKYGVVPSQLKKNKAG